MHLEDIAIQKFLKKFDSLDGLIYGEVGYVTAEARGRNIGARALTHLGKWLIDNMDMKCMYFHLIGMYAMRALLEYGFTLEHTMYYDEFEYEGKKIFSEVAPSKYFIEPNRPGSYLVSIYRDDILKKFTQMK